MCEYRKTVGMQIAPIIGVKCTLLTAPQESRSSDDDVMPATEDPDYACPSESESDSSDDNDEEYTLPVKRCIQQQPDTHSAAKKAKTVPAIEHEAVCTANQDIAAELSTLKVDCTTVQKQLSTMELKSNVMKRKLTMYEPKRVNQKMKRKAAIIQQRNMQVKRLQCKVKKLETKLVTGDSRTDRLRRSNAQLQRKLAHHKEKTDQKPRLNQSADLSSLKDKVSFLENENATLSEHIQQLDNEKISAKVDEKTYSDA